MTNKTGNTEAGFGVCGITPDAMAMRDMLLRNAMGASIYAQHAYEAFRTLKATIEGKTPFRITDLDKLYWFAGQCGVNTKATPDQVALWLSDFLMYELHRGYEEPSRIIEVFAPSVRQKVWRDLAIYPAGTLHEIKDAVASCLINVNGDFISLVRKCLRLGITTIYGAQIGIDMVQDILFGTPMPHEVEVDLGILDPDYVNIVFNGHEPWEQVTKAISGFSTEAVFKVLGGTLEPLASAIKAAKIKGIVALVNCATLATGSHDYVTVSLAKELIKRDILIVSGGCGNNGLEVAGLCNLDAIQVAGPGLKEICGTFKIPPVLSFGTCTYTARISMLTTALANHLGVDSADLPAAVTAPQYLEQKATIDGMFALAYGLYTHLSPTPPVAGGRELVKLLTEDMEGLTGGKIALGDDPLEIAIGIEEHIKKKRAKIGLN
ncbi:hypothetical protein [Phosphitispora sp. TUW77]|uniref:hypothetical protein n=1 Tax=Phosphitispora sp. TUW77 TaxID=3152361 RepID=UPI003AB5E6AC